MWPSLEDMLSNPAIATLVSIFAGGLITWLAAWIYYKRAGDEFRAETALLRKANMVVAYMLEHPDAEVEVHRDEAGNPIGLVVSATAHASGKATVKGIGAEAKRDSNQRFQPTPPLHGGSVATLGAAEPRSSVRHRVL